MQEHASREHTKQAVLKIAEAIERLTDYVTNTSNTPNDTTNIDKFIKRVLEDIRRLSNVF